MYRQWFTNSTCRICVITLALIGACLALPHNALAQPTSTFQETTLNVFVPCADGGNGEIVTITGTLHLLIPPNAGDAIHGNWSRAKGVGLTTGDQYVLAGSPSNLVPAADGEYLTNITLIGTGPGAKFTITRIGPLFQPPTEVRQVHCR